MKPPALFLAIIPFALAAQAQEEPVDIRIEHAQHAAAIDPMLMAAWQAYRAGDLDTAAQRYGEVLRNDAQSRNPPSRDALLGMAAIARQHSQDAAAARYYNELLALDPRDPDAHAGLSVLRAEADAESRLKLLLAERPEAVSLHSALGSHYAQQARWSEARRAYAGALALEPADARLAFNLAVSLDHLGERESAAQHYRLALQLDEPAHGELDRPRAQARLDELGQQRGRP